MFRITHRWQIGRLVLFERHVYDDGRVRRMFWHRVYQSGESFRKGPVSRWRERRYLRKHGIVK